MVVNRRVHGRLYQEEGTSMRSLFPTAAHTICLKRLNVPTNTV